MECQKCHHEVEGNYCSNCGHHIKLPRIDANYIRNEIGSVFTLEKGIFLTILELFIRPGQNIRKFIHEDRNRLVKPIIFVLVCSLFYTVIQQILHFEDGYFKFTTEQQETAVVTIYQWIQKNYGYANIISAFFIAFWTWILFKKSGYNFFEILVLIFFTIGMSMLIFSVFGILDSASGYNLYLIGAPVGYIYSAWAIGQFFNQSSFFKYIKAMLAYIIGFLTFSFAAIVLGMLIDVINK